MTRIIQINLGRSKEAQDLLIQHSGELKAVVCAVSEPARTPGTQSWFYSRDGLAAIFINTRIACYPATLAAQGQSAVMVKYGHIYVLSCYVSPNTDNRGYANFLDELTTMCSGNNRNLIVCGDFNAHSRFWGSRTTNYKGDLLEDWAAQADLRLANVGDKYTFMGHRGSSIIDLTWASPDIFGRIVNWSVREDLETLSDHLCISFEVSESGRSTSASRLPKPIPRWNFREVDKTFFQESMEWSCAVTPRDDQYMINFKPDKWLHKCFSDACRAAVPLVRPSDRSRRMYWWSPEIARLRAESVKTRRLWTRGLSRDTREISNRKRATYMSANLALKYAIKKAKSSAWQELIDTINDDPWGLPYKIVLNRLRKTTPSLLNTLEPDDLRAILDKLFPPGNPLTSIDLGDCEGDRTLITPGEVKEAIQAKKNPGTAPGPDGFKATALNLMPPNMLARLTQCYNIMLKYGVFPPFWKVADLVLIPKGVPALGEIPKARPICLLNEVGKTFERIIARRLTVHMDENPNSNLSEYQFGFRRMRSTTDALSYVKRIITEARRDGKMALAFSLDIENAFNSLLLSGIRRAMRARGFSKYLIRIVESFLTDRKVRYVTSDGKRRFRFVNRGVPQGSALGPLLWNLAFDCVLRTLILDNCHIVCYADDTLLIVIGQSFDSICAKAMECLERILISIRELGLKVSWTKSEAIFFGSRPRDSFIEIEGHRVLFVNVMKYLGVFIDRRWNFVHHFAQITSKATRISRALCGVLPNLRGPLENKRRLYFNVITSIILYAAPIWCEELAASGNQRRIMGRTLRLIASRTIMAYRTVSYEAATLLARIPPIHLYAFYLRRVYLALDEMKRAGTCTPDNCKQLSKELHDEERVTLRRQWLDHIKNVNLPGRRTRDAIIPCFEAWLDRASGFLSFRITQLLTGHGCFGAYLHRIGKEDSPLCRYCQIAPDTAEHTLSECTHWGMERGELTAVVGQDLSLAAVVASICDSREAWTAFAVFAERVMSTKEEDERRRQRGLVDPPVVYGVAPDDYWR